ncbi:MAG: hypothetical protein L0G99_08705 [Propionibacteriales bacterium]|nr:hypothetical protein [Propionibacteriales bacterium]
MSRSRTVTALGAVASVIAIAVTALASDGVRNGLAGAYSYPNAQGLSLGDAASMTLTYLFTIGGIALLTSALYLLVRPLSRSQAGWWIGAAVAALGLAVAAYNASQELPVIVKVAFFLPAIVGVVWLALPDTRRSTRTGIPEGTA